MVLETQILPWQVVSLQTKEEPIIQSGSWAKSGDDHLQGGIDMLGSKVPFLGEGNPEDT